LTGDSAVFGWGLNDQETIGWLLQERLMSYEVINMSATGYSTVNALEQLRIEFPIVNTNDIVILPYHPVSNDFNVLPQERLTLRWENLICFRRVSRRLAPWIKITLSRSARSSCRAVKTMRPIAFALSYPKPRAKGLRKARSIK
jgi:hypothetical protein